MILDDLDAGLRIEYQVSSIQYQVNNENQVILKNSNIFVMKPFTCQQAEQFFSFILDNEHIPEAERKLFDDHLAQCKQCRISLQHHQQVNQVIKSAFDQHIHTGELGAFIDEMLKSETEKMRIQSHLKKCDSCQETFQQLQHLNEFESIFEIRMPRFWLFQKRVKRLFFLVREFASIPLKWRGRLYYAIVAGATITIASLFLIKTITRTEQKQSEIINNVVQQDTIIDKQVAQHHDDQIAVTQKEPQKQPGSLQKKRKDKKQRVDEVYAANFVPSPLLEGLLSYNARSSSLKITSPNPGANFKSDILFEWEKIDDSPTYLKVLNNKGIQIENITPTTNQFILKKTLTPGLYYWKLETDDELLYMGKFFVSKN